VNIKAKLFDENSIENAKIDTFVFATIDGKYTKVGKVEEVGADGTGTMRIFDEFKQYFADKLSDLDVSTCLSISTSIAPSFSERDKE
jgi:hypothetical protein